MGKFSCWKERRHVDEIMRCLQSHPAEAPAVRFGALSVWMVLVGLPEFQGWINVRRTETQIRRAVMAKVIEFYVPENFRPQLKWAPQLQMGKVIEFPSQAEKSSEPYELDWMDRPWASLP